VKILLNIRDCLTLKACRIIANIKADDMADFVGVTVDTLYKWEKNRSFPNLPQIHKIIQCFAERGYIVDMSELNFFDH
jgi:DNA-binding XRE family transcriptional regulator